MLWSAAALTLALALFPTYVEHLIDGDGIGAKAGISGEVRTFRVDGMTCSGCAGGLASRLQGLPGVLGAEVNYEAGLARVEIESERNDGAVLDAIAAAGFQGAPND